MVIHVKPMMTVWLAALVVLMSAGAGLAHHSLANHNTTKAVRVKGTIVQFNKINPHSFIYVEETLPDGQKRRWAVEGPGIFLLQRRGLDNLLKPGDVVEVCGYPPNENTVWQIASADGKTSLAGRLITAELIVLPDGKVQEWEDYGFHHCFPPDHRDRHSK
jgi:uncharacterized protein DUF6152